MASVSVPSSSRGPYQSGILRRAQIVEAASAVFGELGYIGGSLRAIADRVGVSPGLLVQHFGSKEELLAAVLDDWQQKTQAAQSWESLKGLVYFQTLHKLMAFHTEHRGLLELFVTMAAEATSTTHPARKFIQQRYTDIIANWGARLREARDQGEIGPLSDHEIETEIRMLTAMADGLELQWLLDPSIDLMVLFSTYLDDAIRRWTDGVQPSKQD